jgi:two-component system sensor histidine kinase EvgS
MVQHAKYLTALGCWLLALGGLRADSPALTPADLVWLEDNPRVSVSYDPHWEPFSFRDEQGRFRGLDADVLHELGRRLGIVLEPVHAGDWPEAYRRALAGEVQVLTGTARAPEREAHFLFTRPYVSFPVAIFTREESPAIDDFSQLIGSRVAAVRDYAATLALRRDFPEIELLECATVGEALGHVAAGRADAVLTNLVNAAHVIRRDGLMGLKVAGLGPYSFQLRLAVRRDQPALHRALDAAIASLDRKDRQQLLAPYVSLETGAVVSSRQATAWAAAAAGLGLLVAGAFAWHHRRLRRELEERRRLQVELETSRDRLARLNEEKTGLMRMAAHDLRNPLGGLLLGLDVLRIASPAEREDELLRMRGQVDRMMHLIRNLLDVQALETGSRRLHPEPIALEAALPESLAAFETEAKRKRIRLDAEIPSGLVVRADRSALRQICDNLISNAVKYSPAGGAVQVAARATPGGRTVRLAVRDEGPGVRPEEMPRLFQKYTCLSARPTAGESSTGLGLSIVRELSQRLGGRVWCESESGRGATFYVELPAPDAPPADA